VVVVVALALGQSNGIAFLVAYGITCEAIAKDVSSPQTAEMNIRKRARTLMKWVHIGQTESLFVVVIAAAIDKKHRNAIIAGGVLGMAITEIEYVYAKQSGLTNPGPPTEEYPPASGGGFSYG
jgi:hypothetical protein